MKKNLFRNILFLCFFRPLIWIFLGLTVKNNHRLPLKGPAILVANHNSHLDTILLMTLYPVRYLFQIRPVAAADYFNNRYLSWFYNNILQIITIKRTIPFKTSNPLQKISDALQEGSIIIFYPEGTRGSPEQMGEFKKGIVRLAEQHPHIPIVPIYLQGLGKVLAKGQRLLVPFNIKAVIGDPLKFEGNKNTFIILLREKIASLAKELQHV